MKLAVIGAGAIILVMGGFYCWSSNPPNPALNNQVKQPDSHFHGSAKVKAEENSKLSSEQKRHANILPPPKSQNSQRYKFRGQMTVTEWRNMWDSLAKTNPPDALIKLAEIDERYSESKIQAFQSVFDQLDTLDPRYVWQLALKHLGVDDQRSVAFRLFKNEQKDGILRATQSLIANFQSAGLVDDNLVSASALVAGEFEKTTLKDRVAALSLLEKSNPKFASQVIRELTNSIRVGNLNEALLTVDSVANSPNLLKSALSGLDGARVEDYSSIASFISQKYSANSASYQAMCGITGSWALADPISASEFIATLSPGPFRDYAVAGFVQGASKTLPDQSDLWLATIKDPVIHATAISVSRTR